MALCMLFDSPVAKKLNIQFFETIYHGALEASSEMAECEGPYETWIGSLAQLSQLQYDMWGVTPDLWDWVSLKEKIAQTGLTNSLLVAPMPTAQLVRSPVITNVLNLTPGMSIMMSCLSSVKI